MTLEKFEALVNEIYKNYNGNGDDIVIFGKQKYSFEDNYSDFEIIVTKNYDLPGCYDDMIIDYDYNEGQDEYLFDGWCYLYDLLDRAHRENEFTCIK